MRTIAVAVLAVAVVLSSAPCSGVHAAARGPNAEGMENLADLLGAFGASPGSPGGGRGGGRARRSRSICPSGRKFIAPRAIVDVEPGMLVANGCGPQGMEVKESFGLWPCCNIHDVCYSSCGTTFSFCEKRFKKCMKTVCNSKTGEEKTACENQSRSFSSMTGVFGKNIHYGGMKAVCECYPTEGEAKEQHRAFITDVIGKASLDEVEENQVIEKYFERLDVAYKESKKKHRAGGKLVHDIIIEFGEHFIEKGGSVPVSFAVEQEELQSMEEL